MNLENEINKKANLWVIKEQEGLSLDEKKELEVWLKNKYNKKAFDENKQLLHDCLCLDEAFINEIETEALSNNTTSLFFQNIKYIAASIAAVFIIVFSLFTFNDYNKPSFNHEYLTLNEKNLNITLPDNSIIDLDIKSEMKIAYFKDRRTVDLIKGKALFSVSKDKTKPFIIKSGKTSIEVIGTKFEVINVNNNTTVNVLEGLVKISHIYNEKGDIKTLIRLSKEKTFSLDDKGKVRKNNKINIDNIATWKEDYINFNKNTLTEAFKSFQRYSNQAGSFENYEISQYKITGKFSTKHYEGFLNSIELLYPVKVVKEGNSIKIVKK